jgi:hypothetical protein
MEIETIGRVSWSKNWEPWQTWKSLQTLALLNMP